MLFHILRPDSLTAAAHNAEPATLAFLALGAIGMMVKLRRRRLQ